MMCAEGAQMNDREEAPGEPAEAEAIEDTAGEDLVELILASAEAPVEPQPLGRIDGVVVGTLVGFTSSGEAVVDYPGNPAAASLEARSTVALSEADRGHEVALLFERGDPQRPLVMGRMHRPAPVAEVAPTASGEASVTRDGERLVFSAEREIVLQCGKASITLTKAGKILIKGAYLLTRSSGVNRIQGGSVQIN
jgi:hypothetical protein